jgi:LPXTG-motif cell wall-anchored protein
MEIKLPSTGSHRLDWSLILVLAIVMMAGAMALIEPAEQALKFALS